MSLTHEEAFTKINQIYRDTSVSTWTPTGNGSSLSQRIIDGKLRWTLANNSEQGFHTLSDDQAAIALEERRQLLEDSERVRAASDQITAVYEELCN